MNTLQLYVNDERVELFPDEKISVTSSIQNVKDISKIFTDFSQSFTVPATRKNNKIFKHYYNWDVVDGLDARVRQDSLIQINHQTFRKGKLSLMGVNMKNNSPASYRVVFYGSTVTLPDLMGEDKLQDLDLSEYNHDYGVDNVQTGLTSSLKSGNIIYPLITHTKRLYFDSNGTTTNDGNLFYDVSYPDRGVNFTDLKPAIKLNRIIDAIEAKYGLTFSSTFFDGTIFDNLFMWLHRKKGGLSIADGVTFSEQISNFIKSDESTAAAELMTDGKTLVFNTSVSGGAANTIDATFTLTPDTNKTYKLRIYDNDDILKEASDLSGEFTETFTFTGENATHSITVEIETSNGLTNYDAQWSVRETVPSASGGFVFDKTGIYNANNQSLLSRVNIQQNMPDMKVIDFLTNIFKLFNLTSYVQADGSIYVETLDTYYSQAQIFDITKYVDTGDSQIDRALPYKKVSFEFSEASTFLASKRNQLIGGTPYGNIYYNGGNIYDGTDYTLKLDFEKMLYERLSDEADGRLTKISYGWVVEYNGDTAEAITNPNPALGKPIIFFNSLTSTGDGISWDGDEHIKLTQYNRASNNYSQMFHDPFAGIDFYTPIASLNFGAEIDEFYTTETNTSSLFSEYYSTYIKNVFNSKARLIKVSAKLPNKIILNYGLNDIIIINGRQYMINTIETDLMTGKSNIQLINKL